MVGRRRHLCREVRGWKIFDNAALSNFIALRVSWTHTGRVTMLFQYLWQLDVTQRPHPLLVQGSRPASGRFQTFKNLQKSPSNASGVLPRMLINSEAALERVAEASGLPSGLIDAARVSFKAAALPSPPSSRRAHRYHIRKLLLIN